MESGYDISFTGIHWLQPPLQQAALDICNPEFPITLAGLAPRWLSLGLDKNCQQGTKSKKTLSEKQASFPVPKISESKKLTGTTVITMNCVKDVSDCLRHLVWLQTVFTHSPP